MSDIDKEITWYVRIFILLGLATGVCFVAACIWGVIWLFKNAL